MSGAAGTVEKKPVVRVDDSLWQPGDQVRLWGLHTNDTPPTLQAVNSVLATLGERCTKSDAWYVEVQGTRHLVKSEHLRVCSSADEARWSLQAFGLCSKVVICVLLLATLGVLSETHRLVEELSAMAVEGHGAPPGERVAVVVCIAAAISLIWLFGTVGGCYWMHEALMDPEVSFPQISELGAGPATAKALYRIGFASVAALLASLVFLHRELALPHLPGGRHGVLGANFSWWAFAAAAGVAAQGLFLLETKLSWQTALHGIGAIMFFNGVWCHMGAAQRLYLPAVPAPDAPGYEEVAAVADEAAKSALLQDTLVTMIVWFRHSILMRAPAGVFIVPLWNQFSERAGTPSNGTSPRVRNMMGLVQWFIVFDFAIIFISYGPELVVASTLPYPQRDE